MAGFLSVKSRSHFRLEVFATQDLLLLSGLLVAMIISLLCSLLSTETLSILLDGSLNKDMSRVAVVAQRHEIDKLLDMLEVYDTEPSAWSHAASEPPPSPPPGPYSFRPLDADEDPSPIAKRLRMARALSQALESSEQRDIDWEASGKSVETGFDVNDNVAPALGLDLNLGMAFAPIGHIVNDDATFDAPMEPSTTLASPILSGLGFNLGDTSDAFPVNARPGFDMNLGEDTDALPATFGLGASFNQGAATTIEDDDFFNHVFGNDLRDEPTDDHLASSTAQQDTSRLVWHNDISPVPDSYNDDRFVVGIYIPPPAPRGGRVRGRPDMDDTWPW